MQADPHKYLWVSQVYPPVKCLPPWRGKDTDTGAFY